MIGGFLNRRLRTTNRPKTSSSSSVKGVRLDH